jgi:hydrogenase maturation protein HypF
MQRRRIRVTGIVQGVGFRPFVFALAARCALTGFVGNDSQGVFIEVEGSPTALETFQAALVTEAPPLAHVVAVSAENRTLQYDAAFTIVHSQAQSDAGTLVAPDVSICDDCLNELTDSADRRYQYAFINCTNCGPRFTIITDIPYDRPLTTMADFALCVRCQAEYDDPTNRRFHAQPNACPDCGPQVWLEGAGRTGQEAVRAVQDLLGQGQIVAVKGIGGFHLVCDAANDAVVARLRERKGRVDKPFAVMARDLATVRQFADLSAVEAQLLQRKERPIVLLTQRDAHDLAPLIAPGNATIGVMLPYSPLHYLLLDGPLAVLVMTSGNVANEPIVTGNAEAQARLGRLADAFLLHNRPIHARCDDSVVRVVDETLLPIRRSRGYAPFPVQLPFAVPPILAVGGELKATFCLTKDDYAFMSQHIGDMENLETLHAFAEAVNHFEHIFRIAPQAIACDLHPGYLATEWAQQRAGSRPVIPVQHHHAHIAAVMAEHQLDGSEPVIGFSFDGTGYGTDGKVWGGEVLLADYAGFERAFHLKYVPLPGGDVAVKRPYRLALAHLWAAGVAWSDDLPPVAACSESERGIVRHQLETGLNSVATSSFGRLFDAVSALIDVRQTISYEGQAAIELECLSAENCSDRYTFAISGDVFDAAPVIRAIVDDLRRDVAANIIGAKFHNAVADLIVQISLLLHRQTGTSTVVLSGGVFQNVTLLKLAVSGLKSEGFAVLTHELVPPNDGGLALGQAIIAAQRM